MAKLDTQKTLIVKSIGICTATPEDRKKDTCVIIAYATGNQLSDVSFVAVKMPPKNTVYSREELLAFICRAENVKNITYVDFDGKDKDIYLCRASEGIVIDIIPRDDYKNSYGDGFAEIESCHLNFCVESEKIKFGKKLKQIKVTYNTKTRYEKNSLPYAIANAFNACLLGRVFSRYEFQLKTGDHKRVKCEVRTVQPKYVDAETLYIKPRRFSADGAVNAYIPEPIHVVDGNTVNLRAYAISYDDYIKDYQIQINIE